MPFLLKFKAPFFHIYEGSTPPYSKRFQVQIPWLLCAEPACPPACVLRVLTFMFSITFKFFLWQEYENIEVTLFFCFHPKLGNHFSLTLRYIIIVFLTVFVHFFLRFSNEYSNILHARYLSFNWLSLLKSCQFWIFHTGFASPNGNTFGHHRLRPCFQSSHRRKWISAFPKIRSYSYKLKPHNWSKKSFCRFHASMPTVHQQRDGFSIFDQDIAGDSVGRWRAMIKRCRAPARERCMEKEKKNPAGGVGGGGGD